MCTTFNVIKIKMLLFLLIKYFIVSTCKCRSGTTTFQLRKDVDGVKTNIEYSVYNYVCIHIYTQSKTQQFVR